MDKPNIEKYGWQSSTSFEEESGWMIEGGEEAYYKALKKWKELNSLCECELHTSDFELDNGTICCCKCEKGKIMPRERLPLVRSIKPKENVIINLRDIWRNADIQDEVIKVIKQFKK